LRVTGFDNRGDSGWSIDPTDWRSGGAFSGLAIDRIPPDCAVYLEAQVHPPSTAGSPYAYAHIRCGRKRASIVTTL